MSRPQIDTRGLAITCENGYEHRWENVGSGNFCCLDCRKYRCHANPYPANLGARCDEAVGDSVDAEMCAGCEAWALGMGELVDSLQKPQIARAA